MADLEMTHQQIAEEAERLRQELQELTSEQVGYGNYKRIMARYQRILNDLIVLQREDAEADAKAEKGVQT